jgi:thiamine biosynthesis protein ThiS
MARVRVLYQGKEQKLVVPDRAAIADVLKKLGINRETVIVSQNSVIVPDTAAVNENDHIDIVRIISGG